MDVSTNFDVDCRYSDNPRDFCSRIKDRQRGLITNGLSRSSFLSGTGKKGAEIVSKSPQQKYLCLG